ncbi:MAG: hypothetical protein ACTSWY_12790, partial [Promethearchaeota archaeon]
MQFFSFFAFHNILRDPEFVPTVQDFSRWYHSVPVEAFKDQFSQLIEELMKLHLITFKVMIWDCQFIHSNASDYKNKKTGQYSDAGAGIGRHNNKFLGVGYMASTLYL